MSELLTIKDWPRPGDRARSRLGLERWRERAAETGDPGLERFAAALAADRTGRAMLEALFGNSPFLTEAALREIGLLRTLVEQGVDAPFRGLLDDLDARCRDERDTAQLMAALRCARRQVALVVGLADIAGVWPLTTVTGALSSFAEAALRLTVRHLLRRAADSGILEPGRDPDDPAAGSGLIVLGMGKLGARELNYSSDIDLIVLYDEARVRTMRPDDLARSFIRMTRDLVRIMEERTPDGYVFRTDLRLRPDPGATPIAVSVAAAELYYASLAQNWERAAMIKARPVAGDLAAGAEFLKYLHPFVWRRALDFAAIQDIHTIKRQINVHRGHAAIAINGHNIKLGRGGIREIEFFVQTQQLIFGGRDPRLRCPATCDGLKALAAAGRIDADTAEDLILAYHFLRQVEHRLQMVDDQQTHTLPASDAGIDALSSFLGFATPEMFRRRLRRTLERVESRYADLFEEAPALPGPGDLVFTGSEDDPDTLRTLQEMGYANPAAVTDTVRGWLHGRYRATRSERSRTLLKQLLPALLQSLRRTQNPDTALLRLDEFLSRLPTGVQLFSLFCANPDLLDLVAEILGTSPRLANHLAHNPIQLDSVLTPGFFDRLPDAAALEEELARLLEPVEAYEEVLNVVRRWTNDHRFRAGVQILRHVASGLECGRFLLDVAEVALRALMPRVEAEFGRRHGGFGREGLAVIAMGKLGGREMTVRSDLDLITVYDTAGRPPESDGIRPLSPNAFYTRLTQRLISAITVPTREGALYEVDMRLRPSGNAGPLAVSLESFLKYQHESAWTWEHMALTRARVIAGPPELREVLERTITEVLCRPRDARRLLRDVAEMRARIAKEHLGAGLWDVKHGQGGLVDIEFIAQYLQLRHAAEVPRVLDPNTGTALLRLADAGLLDNAMALDLIEALQLWQRIQSYLRLTHDGPFDPAKAPPALRTGVARAAFPDRPAGTLDFAQVEERIRLVAARAHLHYQTLIEIPAAALGPPEAEAGREGSAA